MLIKIITKLLDTPSKTQSTKSPRVFWAYHSSLEPTGVQVSKISIFLLIFYGRSSVLRLHIFTHHMVVNSRLSGCVCCAHALCNVLCNYYMWCYCYCIWHNYLLKRERESKYTFQCCCFIFCFIRH